MRVSSVIADIIQIVNRSHSSLQNLTADDHTDYLINVRHDLQARHPLTVIGNVGGAQGDIMIWTGAAWVKLAAGTSGQFLKTQGAGANPAWDIVAIITRGFSVSANLRNSNDTERTSPSTTYVKVKEVLLNENLGAVTLKFSQKTGAGGEWTWGRIYKNGVAIGTERVYDGVAYTEYTENFSGWLKNDLIQIYAKVAAGGTVYIKDMRFYYDYNLTKLGAETLTTPLEVTELSVSMTNQDP